jgi:trk system potassium uptake protein TrkA
VHIVVLGCGRVGARIAHELDAAGHSVAVIDQDAKSFRRLGEDFGGSTVTGIGFDRQTLERAGIERAHGFAAVSSGDNSNIIAARVARETYGVERVVARIYDLRRAEVYERLGIPTVATVAWTAGQMLRRLTASGTTEVYRDPSGTVALLEVVTPTPWVGRVTTEFEAAAHVRVAFIMRLGAPLVPEPALTLQADDVLHLVVCVEGIPAAQKALDRGPEGDI